VTQHLGNIINVDAGTDEDDATWINFRSYTKSSRRTYLWRNMYSYMSLKHKRSPSTSPQSCKCFSIYVQAKFFASYCLRLWSTNRFERSDNKRRFCLSWRGKFCHTTATRCVKNQKTWPGKCSVITHNGAKDKEARLQLDRGVWMKNLLNRNTHGLKSNGQHQTGYVGRIY
jgi:hypothetical protein